MDDNLIYWKDLKKGETYFLTGAYWNFDKHLTNEPVKFLYFEDGKDKKIDSVGKKKNCSAICKLLNTKIQTTTGLVRVDTELFICPIDKKTKKPMVKSRITGEFIPNGGSLSDANIAESFDVLSEIIANKPNGKHDNRLKHLKCDWNFDTKIIEITFETFDKSFDLSDTFLNILDGSDTITEAWDVMVDEYNINSEYPFGDLEK